MSIDSDTEAIEKQLRTLNERIADLNEQIAEIVALLKEQAKDPKAEDAPASATEAHENPPDE